MSNNDFFGPAFSLAFVAGDSVARREELFALPRACGTVPAMLQPGTEYRVRHVDSSAFGAAYILEGIQDGACLKIEVSTRGVLRAGLSVGARVTVTVNGLGRVLVSAGEAVAFVPNTIGRALLEQQGIRRPEAAPQA